MYRGVQPGAGARRAGRWLAVAVMPISNHHPVGVKLTARPGKRCTEPIEHAFELRCRDRSRRPVRRGRSQRFGSRNPTPVQVRWGGDGEPIEFQRRPTRRAPLFRSPRSGTVGGGLALAVPFADADRRRPAARPRVLATASDCRRPRNGSSCYACVPGLAYMDLIPHAGVSCAAPARAGRRRSLPPHARPGCPSAGWAGRRPGPAGSLSAVWHHAGEHQWAEQLPQLRDPVGVLGASVTAGPRSPEHAYRIAELRELFGPLVFTSVVPDLLQRSSRPRAPACPSSTGTPRAPVRWQRSSTSCSGGRCAAHSGMRIRSHTPGPARMRNTNSRSGASGSSDAVARTRQQRIRSPPIGIGEGKGQGDSSIHRSWTSVTEKSGALRIGRRWNSTGSPSTQRTWIGSADASRNGCRRPHLNRLRDRSLHLNSNACSIRSVDRFPGRGSSRRRPGGDRIWA